MFKFLSKRRDETLRLECLKLAQGGEDWAAAMYNFVKGNKTIDTPKGAE